MMKISYTRADLRTVEIDLKQALLTGSITSTPLFIPKGDVTVTSFKEDQSFKDNGFDDISF